MGDGMTVTVRGFRDLRVWQQGMSLVEMVYQLTKSFPKSEIYSLASQMQRAAVSVPSNIAEGHTREYTKEYLQAVSTAQGSLAELQTQCEVSLRLGYISESEFSEFSAAAVSLAKQLYSLRNSIKDSGKV